MRDAFGLRGLEGGERGCRATKVQQATVAGGDRLVVAGADVVEISASGFGGGLAAGMSTSAAGVGQLAYEAGAGPLLWDADGAGGADAVLVAVLDGAPGLAAADLRVIA